jgi:hypothetical protein
METTTHSTSEGDVLPSTDHDDFDDAPRAHLTFEQRTIRTLLAFERRRLAMQQTQLAMEHERLAAHRAHVAADAARGAAITETMKVLLPPLVPVLTELLAKLFDGGSDDANEALDEAIADVVSEFPDLKETLEGRVRARREAESRAAVG